MVVHQEDLGGVTMMTSESPPPRTASARRLSHDEMLRFLNPEPPSSDHYRRVVAFGIGAPPLVASAAAAAAMLDQRALALLRRGSRCENARG